MSVRRMLPTTAAMAAIAEALAVLAPSPAAVLGALASPQALVDTAGPGALVLAAVAGLAWLVWAWGALGLLLTAAGALPGVLGWAARLLLRAVLPAGARQAAAVALGLGVALQVPLAATALASTGVTVPAVAPAGAAVPDWPTGSPDGTGTPPLEPSPSPASHVVVRGDCLWDIATDHLRTANGRSPSATEVARGVAAWWSENRAVIGSDPDLVLPGQVLTPPQTP